MKDFNLVSTLDNNGSLGIYNFNYDMQNSTSIYQVSNRTKWRREGGGKYVQEGDAQGRIQLQIHEIRLKIAKWLTLNLFSCHLLTHFPQCF